MVLKCSHILRNIVNFVLEREIINNFTKLSLIIDMRKKIKRRENNK